MSEFGSGPVTLRKREEYVVARIHDVPIEHMVAFGRVAERIAKERGRKSFFRAATDGSNGMEFIEVAEVADE